MVNICSKLQIKALLKRSYKMQIEKTELQDAYIITPDVFGDSRGWFMETYSKTKLQEITGIEFVQDNQSYSSQKGIVRGLHCQTNPHSSY